MEKSIMKKSTINTPDVSIILPVYNASVYLQKCVDSILSQDGCDIELIIIDDGSTDGSEFMVDEYALRDDRVIVEHIAFSDVANARNHGIALATGKYVMFVDSDDWISDGCVSKIFNYAWSNNLDMLITSYYKVNSTSLSKRKIFEKECMFQGDNGIESLFAYTMGPIEERAKDPSALDSLVPVWSKLYKREIIVNNKIKYISPNLIPSECLQFNLDFIEKAGRIQYIDFPFYYYVRNNLTSTTRPFRDDLLEKWLNWYNTYKEEYLSKSKRIQLSFYSRMSFSLVPLSGNALKHTKFSQQIKEIRNILFYFF